MPPPLFTSGTELQVNSDNTVSDAPSSTSTLPAAIDKNEATGRALRLTTDNLNRLLGLAGESLVESRWLHPFADSLLRLKRFSRI